MKDELHVSPLNEKLQAESSLDKWRLHQKRELSSTISLSMRVDNNQP